jgi:hypothetical protein
VVPTTKDTISNRVPTREESDDLRILFKPKEVWEGVWENGHKARMVLEAEKYSALMPKLEWIYIGQVCNQSSHLLFTSACVGSLRIISRVEALLMAPELLPRS